MGRNYISKEEITMLEIIVFVVFLVLAQTLAGLIMMNKCLSKEFIKKYSKMAMEVAEEIQDEMEDEF